MKHPLVIIFILITNFISLGVSMQHPKLLNYDSPDKIPNKYIITLKDRSNQQTTRLSFMSQLRSKSEIEFTDIPPTSDLSNFGLHIIPVYLANDNVLSEVLNLPEVAYVETDFRIYPSCVSQSGASWGLNRISGRNQASTTYDYEGGGENVTIYIVDSGVRVTHQDFGGRAVFGTCIPSSINPTTDILNHGTGVASCAAGTSLGTAKNATIVSVRVFDDFGLSTLTDNVLGIAYTLNHHYNESVRLNPGLTQLSQHTVTANADNLSYNRSKSIINMSFGSHQSSAALDSILQTVDSYGMISVAAAGNDGHDACNNHPASSPYAITVGCTNSSDHRCGDSNYGSCVDIFAPGHNIAIALGTGNAITGTDSGTSFSAPYVSGVIANYMSTLPPTKTPTRLKVKRWLESTRTKCSITFNDTVKAACTDNVLVFQSCGVAMTSHSYPNASSCEVPSCGSTESTEACDTTCEAAASGAAAGCVCIAIAVTVYIKRKEWCCCWRGCCRIHEKLYCCVWSCYKRDTEVVPDETTRQAEDSQKDGSSSPVTTRRPNSVKLSS